MNTASKVTSKGRTTIPAQVRAYLSLTPGDLIAWDVRDDGTATVKRYHPIDREYLRATEDALSEWSGDADDAAYRDL